MEIKHLEVLLMPNGEIICAGKTIGWEDSLGKYLHEPETDSLSVKNKAEINKGVTRTLNEYGDTLKC